MFLCSGSSRQRIVLLRASLRITRLCHLCMSTNTQGMTRERGGVQRNQLYDAWSCGPKAAQPRNNLSRNSSMLRSRSGVSLGCYLRQVLEHDALVHVLHHRSSWTFGIGCLAGCSCDQDSDLSYSQSQLPPILLTVCTYFSVKLSSHSLFTLCASVDGNHPRSGRLATSRLALPANNMDEAS